MAAIPLLKFLVFFQGISGLMGGVLILLDPSGVYLHLPPEFLDKTPFSNYLIPGLILLIVLGLYPLMVFYMLIKDPQWQVFSFINFSHHQKDSWTATVYLGIVLLGWIIIQVLLIGYQSYLQPFYLGVGVLILGLSFLPVIRNKYQKD